MKTVVVIATYNERENIGPLILELRSLEDPHLRIIVVDDDSPDGTAEVVRRLAKGREDLLLLHRAGTRGRGLAGRDGLLHALSMGADVVVEMDGDLSHDPRDIPRLIEGLQASDVVIGSRMAPGGRESGRPRSRRILTWLASHLARRMMAGAGARVRDPTSGFRAYRREALEGIDVASLHSRGPAIVEEVLLRAVRSGLRIVEVPIHFHQRMAGRSKMRISHLLECVSLLVRWRVRRIIGRRHQGSGGSGARNPLHRMR